MVAEVSGTAISQSAQVRPQAQPWPARAAAYYGLAVIILATALNFMDAQVFYLLAQRIKVTFTKRRAAGFPLGPANIIFICWSPARALVDI
jgi:hypothetical protein